MGQGFRRARARRPQSFREKIESSHRGLDVWAAMAGKPPMEKLYALPPKRAYKKRSVESETLEKDVLAAVSELLASHLGVLLAVRQNSGAMQYEANGRTAPVWFYRLVKRKDVTITDFWGFLRDGRPFAIEAKRPSWRGVSDDRERKQEAFIHLVEAIGGVGGFARSVDEARAIIEGGAI